MGNSAASNEPCELGMKLLISDGPLSLWLLPGEQLLLALKHRENSSGCFGFVRRERGDV